MTLEQFKDKLIEDGYKLTSERLDNYHRFSFEKRKTEIVASYWEDGYSIYYKKSFKDGSYELNQHQVLDFKKAYDKIRKFEGKL